MKMLRPKDSREQAQKRFYGTSEFLMFMAVWAACMGMILIMVAGSALFVEEGLADGCDILCLIMGVAYVVLGVWGILFSGRRKGDFPKHAVIVFDMDFGTDCVLGSILGCVSFGVLWIFFQSVPAFWPCLFWAAAAILVCFLEFLCFYRFRNRRILLQEDSLQYVDGFGRVRCWSNGEIGRIVFHPATERYTVLGRDGEKLFTFQQGLLHASALTCRFPVTSQMPEKAEEGELFERGISAELGNRLRKAGWLLLVGDVLIRLLAAVVYFYTNLLGEWEFYVLMGVVSLDLFVFSRVFGDALWEDWTYEDNGKEKWKGIHRDILLRQTVVLAVSIFSVRGKAERMLQCVSGREAMLLVGILLFAVLLAPCIVRLPGKMRYVRLRETRIFQLVLLMVYTLFVTVILIAGAWEMGCGTPHHGVAQITETKLAHSSRGGDTYYAWVILKDGSGERLKVSRSIYNKIEAQEEVELCERSGWLGTEFAAVHAVGQCPFRERSE